MLHGYGGGGNRFRLDCQKGDGEKEHPRKRGKIRYMSSESTEIRGKRVGKN